MEWVSQSACWPLADNLRQLKGQENLGLQNWDPGEDWGWLCRNSQGVVGICWDCGGCTWRTAGHPWDQVPVSGDVQGEGQDPLFSPYAHSQRAGHSLHRIQEPSWATTAARLDTRRVTAAAISLSDSRRGRKTPSCEPLLPPPAQMPETHKPPLLPPWDSRSGLELPPCLPCALGCHQKLQEQVSHCICTPPSRGHDRHTLRRGSRHPC